MLSADDVHEFKLKLKLFEEVYGNEAVLFNDALETRETLLRQVAGLRDNINEQLGRMLAKDMSLVKGWLEKRKHKDQGRGLVSRWKRRYCCLLNDGLHYYDSPLGAELGHIEVSDVVSVAWADEGRDVILLELRGNVVYELRSEEGAAARWHSKLVAMKPEGFTLVAGTPLCEGLVLKQKERGAGRPISAKKKRYCVLFEYSMHYYDRAGGVLKGEMDLIGLKVQRVLDASGALVSLRLVCANGSAYRLTQASPNTMPMTEWSAAFDELHKALRVDMMNDTTAAPNSARDSQMDRSSGRFEPLVVRPASEAPATAARASRVVVDSPGSDTTKAAVTEDDFVMVSPNDAVALAIAPTRAQRILGMNGAGVSVSAPIPAAAVPVPSSSALPPPPPAELLPPPMPPVPDVADAAAAKAPTAPPSRASPMKVQLPGMGAASPGVLRKVPTPAVRTSVSLEGQIPPKTAARPSTPGAGDTSPKSPTAPPRAALRLTSTSSGGLTGAMSGAGGGGAGGSTSGSDTSSPVPGRASVKIPLSRSSGTITPSPPKRPAPKAPDSEGDGQ